MGVEECDDGNDSNEDWCSVECKIAKCGDGNLYIGFEECDDGNDNNNDMCIDTCEVASCGDYYVHEGVEVCDDGVNDNSYGGCAPGCKKLGPHCGDNYVAKDQGERCDGIVPLDGVTCKSNCFYDFSKITQMYCAGTCSWGGVSGCDQADADIFCKLKLGTATAKATSFKLGSPTNGYGFPCGNPKLYAVIDEMGNDPRLNLGKLPEFGVNQDVMYQSKDILKTHGDKPSIVQISCSP